MSYRYKYRKRYYKEQDNTGPMLFFLLVVGGFYYLLNLYNRYPVLFSLVLLSTISLGIYIFFKINKQKDQKYMNIKTIDDMKKLDWREFEKFIAFVFQKKGYKAKEREGRNDGGIDVDAQYKGQKYIIQCKKWNKYNSLCFQFYFFIFSNIDSTFNLIIGLYLKSK